MPVTMTMHNCEDTADDGVGDVDSNGDADPDVMVIETLIVMVMLRMTVMRVDCDSVLSAKVVIPRLVMGSTVWTMKMAMTIEMMMSMVMLMRMMMMMMMMRKMMEKVAEQKSIITLIEKVLLPTIHISQC